MRMITVYSYTSLAAGGDKTLTYTLSEKDRPPTNLYGAMSGLNATSEIYFCAYASGTLQIANRGTAASTRIAGVIVWIAKPI